MPSGPTTDTSPPWPPAVAAHISSSSCDLGRTTDQRAPRDIERGGERDDRSVAARAAPESQVVLVEDRALELAERRSRFDPELVGERRAGALVRAQGVGLPAGAVERQHELAPQPLAQRRVGDRPLDVGDELARLAEREESVEAILGDEHAQLVQRAGGERAAVDLVEAFVRRALPRRERVVERGHRRTRVTLLEQCPARRAEVRELRRVDLIAPDDEGIGAARGHEPATPDRDSARRRAGAARCRSGSCAVALRGGLSPQTASINAVDRHRCALCREERREHGALLGSAERHVATVLLHRDLAEHREVRCARVVAITDLVVVPHERARCERTGQALQVAGRDGSEPVRAARPGGDAYELGAQDLAGPGRVAEPAGFDHREPMEVVALDHRVADAQPGADRQLVVVRPVAPFEAALQPGRARERLARTAEHGHHAVAGVLHHRPAVGRDRLRSSAGRARRGSRRTRLHRDASASRSKP